MKAELVNKISALPPELVEPVLKELPFSAILELASVQESNITACIIGSPTWGGLFKDHFDECVEIFQVILKIHALWTGQPFKAFSIRNEQFLGSQLTDLLALYGEELWKRIGNWDDKRRGVEEFLAKFHTALVGHTGQLSLIRQDIYNMFEAATSVGLAHGYRTRTMAGQFTWDAGKDQRQHGSSAREAGENRCPTSDQNHIRISSILHPDSQPTAPLQQLENGRRQDPEESRSRKEILKTPVYI
jgi:hypothetical protein